MRRPRRKPNLSGAPDGCFVIVWIAFYPVGVFIALVGTVYAMGTAPIEGPPRGAGYLEAFRAIAHAINGGTVTPVETWLVVISFFAVGLLAVWQMDALWGFAMGTCPGWVYDRTSFLPTRLRVYITLVVGGAALFAGAWVPTIAALVVIVVTPSY